MGLPVMRSRVSGVPWLGCYGRYGSDLFLRFIPEVRKLYYGLSDARDDGPIVSHTGHTATPCQISISALDDTEQDSLTVEQRTGSTSTGSIKDSMRLRRCACMGQELGSV